MTEIYLLIPCILFITGFTGLFFSKKNLILILICLELLLLAVTIHYIFIGWGIFGDYKIIWFAVTMLTVGAAESAIGLAFIIAYHKTIKQN